MSSYILWLDQASHDSLPLVGSKGANLGELTRAGFRVPRGFCLTIAGYRLFLAESTLDHEIATAVHGADPSNRADLQTRLSQVRDAVLASPLPDLLRDELTATGHQLARAAGLLAVRSSALTEDRPDASFAGQHDSFLGVSVAALPDFVRRVWASLWSERASTYRLRLGLGLLDALPAVVVQELVDAEAAGVAFTADPLTGDGDRMVIHGTWGLGEAIVSGQVTPDEYVVVDGAIAHQRVAPKHVQVVPRPDGTPGVATIVVPETHRARPCLPEDRVLELASICRRVEQHMGAPQDIEWAYADGHFYVLQARPITALAVSQSDLTDTDYWTTNNIGEVVPGAVSPLTWSVIRDPLNHAFVWPHVRLGLLTPEEARHISYLKLYQGHAYLNLTELRRASERIPGGSAETIDRMFLGDAETLPAEGRRTGLRGVLQLPAVLWRLVRIVRSTPGEAAEYAAQVRRYKTEQEAVDRAAWTDEGLLEAVNEFIAIFTRGLEIHIAASFFAMQFLDLLSQVVVDVSSQDHQGLTGRMLAAQGGLESAAPGVALWTISRHIAASPTLRALFSTCPPGDLQERLQESPEGRDLWTRHVQPFLDEYGYRSIQEAELMLPNWAEDPSYVLSVLANYAQAGPEADPVRREVERRADRDAAIQQVEAWLGRLSPRRPLFRFLLRQAQVYSMLRENLKSDVIKTSVGGRGAARELGRRLCARGALGPNDVYFLRVDELTALLHGESDAGHLRDLARARRVQYRLDQRHTPPEIIHGQEPLELASAGENALVDGNVLRGLPCSPGRATGRARVVHDPRSCPALAPGDILVAPLTDPGWTPLFLTAGGLVVDLGSLLSHGSIVAREYGIPAVVNTKHAMRVIRDGQMVTVDGNEGTVMVHDERET